MGKKAPKPPPPPDPVVTARAQGEMNVETARTNAALNRVNQYGPLGRITYRDLGRDYADREVQHHIDAYQRGEWRDPNFIRDGNLDTVALRKHFMRPEHNPYLDRWEMLTELSPEQQELYRISNEAQSKYGEAALQQLQGVQERLASPFEFNGPALAADLPDRAGDLQTSVADRAGELVMSVPDYTNRLVFDLPDRTGSLQYGVRDLTSEIKRSADFTNIGDPNQARENVQAALLERLNPQLERERAALEARLANQGISAGTEAWRAGFDDYNRMVNDARLAAILNAGQEQSRMWQLGLAQSGFNNQAIQQMMQNDLARGRFVNDAIGQAAQMDLSRGQFQNNAVGQAAQMDLARAQFLNSALDQAFQMALASKQFQNNAVGQAAQMDLARAAQQNAARQQALQEALALRVQPLNETAALISGEQVRMPTLAPVPQVGLQPPDYQGAVAANYAGQMAGYNARLAQIGAQNAALGNLLGTLGGAAIWKWSDRRLKRDVMRIGTGRYGLPLYVWRYVWGGSGIGYMADEVTLVRPDAVRIGADGFARVNYGALHA